ncbi:hypothetical protein TNCV_623451 [Trichonephila clavipes]|nr:hypothetical protein TNCV_623451 [Trichonephila clavipes]
MRVWRHRDERTFAAYIRHRHTGSSPGVIDSHQTLVTTIYEMWHHVEAAWASVPVHFIQSLFVSMLRRILAVITARVDCSG